MGLADRVREGRRRAAEDRARRRSLAAQDEATRVQVEAVAKKRAEAAERKAYVDERVKMAEAAGAAKAHQGPPPGRAVGFVQKLGGGAMKFANGMGEFQKGMQEFNGAMAGGSRSTARGGGGMEFRIPTMADVGMATQKRRKKKSKSQSIWDQLP